ncbi:MAG TPA: response regulator [Xenococcaceae cyanobacterium]
MASSIATILIVDDCQENCEILSCLLQSYGFEVLIAKTGWQAISIVEQNLLDLILLDIIMPEIDGLETCQRIRSNQKACEIPIIFMTAIHDLETKLKGFELGAVDYITKPFENQEVIARIKTQLSLKQMQVVLKQQNQQLQKEIAQRKLTEQKLRKIEAKERQLNQKLEQKVAERTAALVHTAKELARSNQELKRSNADLESFAYAVSHDLQAPLRSIKMFAELFTQEYQELLQGQPQEYLEYITSSAERMEHLIRDLLAYSRAGKNEQTWIPINLSELVNKSIRDLEATIRETQATIKVDKLPTLMVNPTEISRLFQNLIGNSLKFRSQQEPVIEIGTVYDQDNWQIFVKDNGIGIDTQYHHKIFQVFERLHSEDDYPGTGIGLSICQKVVKRHGGKIWLKSVPDQGSTFYFTLPKNLSAPQKTVLALTHN